MGIIIAVIMGFASMILDTLKTNTFTFTLNVKQEKNPSMLGLTFNDPSEIFMFGIELWSINLNNSTRYFDIVMLYQNSSYQGNDALPEIEVPL